MYQIYLKHTDCKVETPWVILDVPFKKLDVIRIVAQNYADTINRPLKIVNTETLEEYDIYG